jgi:predicted RNA-binding Zn-ribbon protein involved in translation (DUF1610 family)
MMKKIHVAFVSLIAVVAALVFVGPASTVAQQKHQHTASDHVRRRAAKARKRVRQHAVKYVCPMHPDMHSKSRGECPKCGMELVTETDKGVK